MIENEGEKTMEESQELMNRRQKKLYNLLDQEKSERIDEVSELEGSFFSSAPGGG